MIARSAAHQIKYYVLAVAEWVFTRAGPKGVTHDRPVPRPSLPRNRPPQKLLDGWTLVIIVAVHSSYSFVNHECSHLTVLQHPLSVRR
jgi:hypothetical protein